MNDTCSDSWSTARARTTFGGCEVEMATFQIDSQQLNSNAIVKTNPLKISGPSTMPPIPNIPSPQQNSFNVGTKRKETGTPHNDIPYKKISPAWLSGRELFCEICSVELNSVSQATQHRQGKVHLSKVKKVEKFRTVSQGRVCLKYKLK